jgi:hypothetical protein
MAEIRRRRTVIAAKVEATVGTSETLTASECLVLVYDAKFDATIPMFDRKLMDASISPFTPIPGTQMAKVTFKLEIKGSGTAGTAPALGLFLKACGMAETLVALTSATYAPISAAYPALTMAVYTVKNSRFTPGRHCRISPFLRSYGAWRVVELVGIGWCFGASRMARVVLDPKRSLRTHRHTDLGV